MAKINTLFLTKTAKRQHPFQSAHIYNYYIAHISEVPPPSFALSSCGILK